MQQWLSVRQKDAEAGYSFWGIKLDDDQMLEDIINILDDGGIRQQDVFSYATRAGDVLLVVASQFSKTKTLRFLKSFKQTCNVHVFEWRKHSAWRPLWPRG